MNEDGAKNRGLAQGREQILGIQFFNGTAAAAVAEASRGGLVVAPSGTCFERFLRDEEYRRAILEADIVLPDSGLMVTLWRLLQRRRIQRISGLAYLKAFLGSNKVEESRETFWILPNERARQRLLTAAHHWNFKVAPDDSYVAPIYGTRVQDTVLLGLIEARRSNNIVIAIGAGPQEKLGWYLRGKLAHRSAIHCIGGALGFLTGDQIAIPAWADRAYLGWLFRLFSQPKIFIPRLWRGRVLPRLILRYGNTLPPLRASKKGREG
ncbi:MAG: WecB/TagA/CpsF family glycosyltransferase [Chthoniobacterales bacterium]